MSSSLFHMFLKDMLLKCLNMLKKREETECQISDFQKILQIFNSFSFFYYRGVREAGSKSFK